MSSQIFAEIRAASAEVMARARFVHIDERALAALAADLAKAEPPPDADPAHAKQGDPHATLVFVLTLDAINFGSGWFPFLAKHPGRSGYLTLAENWKRRFLTQGAFSAEDLAALGPPELAAALEQDLAVPEVAELMRHFATALNEFGHFVGERHGGSFESVVASAGGFASALVAELATLPCYRDVARYEELTVPFYKRAQITAADLHEAFGGRSFGEFRDLHELTLFADNLVPHVLRRAGVLVYTSPLAARIEAGELIPAGSPEEVEIRAGGVHAVECCVARMRANGAEVTARELDTLLWNRGQRKDVKAHPRHRTRSTFY